MGVLTPEMVKEAVDAQNHSSGKRRYSHFTDDNGEVWVRCNQGHAHYLNVRAEDVGVKFTPQLARQKSARNLYHTTTKDAAMAIVACGLFPGGIDPDGYARSERACTHFGLSEKGVGGVRDNPSIQMVLVVDLEYVYAKLKSMARADPASVR